MTHAPITTGSTEAIALYATATDTLVTSLIPGDLVSLQDGEWLTVRISEPCGLTAWSLIFDELGYPGYVYNDLSALLPKAALEDR